MSNLDIPYTFLEINPAAAHARQHKEMTGLTFVGF
jgi:hypothetical protein